MITGFAKAGPRASLPHALIDVDLTQGFGPFTYTRGSSALWMSSTSLTLQSAPTNVPIYDQDTGALVIQPGSTNQIRNPRAEGATMGTVGSGAVVPTNWVWNAGSGLALALVGTGTLNNGLPYIDLQISGTSTGTYFVFSFEAGNFIVAAPGQYWTNSFYNQIVGGSTANITSFDCQLRWAGAGLTSDTYFTPTASLTRAASSTTAPASTTYVQPSIALGFNTGAAINITLRIAGPQCEQLALPSAIILPPAGVPGASTRYSDNIMLIGVQNLFQPRGFTLCLDVLSSTTGANYTWVPFGANAGTAFACSCYATSPSGTSLQATLITGTNNTTTSGVSSGSPGASFRVAATYAPSVNQLSVRGLLTSNPLVNLNNGMDTVAWDRLTIGRGAWGTTTSGTPGVACPMLVTRFRFFNGPLSAGQLVSLTAK
jgi:hypothetical protein